MKYLEDSNNDIHNKNYKSMKMTHKGNLEMSQDYFIRVPII